jgi:uncharacterized membrane protein YbhN (UPF0104 family)
MRFWAIFIVTNLLSLACLIWVLKGAGLTHIWQEVRDLHWQWVTVAIVADITMYMIDAWRWQLLLRPVKAVSFTLLVEAVYVGLFANEVLPLRAGELIRCFLLSRSSSIPISVAFASSLIERIFDGIWLMAGFFICLQGGDLPGVLLKAGYILGVFIAVFALLLGYGMYSKSYCFGFKWPQWFRTLIEDLHLIGHSRYLYFSFLVSGLYMFAQVIPIYCLVQARELSVPWMASFTIVVLLRLTSVLPQAPSMLGAFQWVTAHTLMMFGLLSPHAKRFSLILWAGLTIPLIIVGFLALALTGLTMGNLQRQATEAAQGRKSEKAS